MKKWVVNLESIETSFPTLLSKQDYQDIISMDMHTFETEIEAWRFLREKGFFHQYKKIIDSEPMYTFKEVFNTTGFMNKIAILLLMMVEKTVTSMIKSNLKRVGKRFPELII